MSYLFLHFIPTNFQIPGITKNDDSGSIEITCRINEAKGLFDSGLLGCIGFNLGHTNLLYASL